jgi:hypothetical protein
VVDVLLGLVVLATVFGRLGVLYIPSLLVFLAVTSRTESPDRSAEARPVEVPVAGSPLDDIEPEAVVERPVVVVDRGAFEPAAATPILLRRHARSSPIVEDEPARDVSRRPGRHRAPSEPRRLASWAVRAGRSVGGLARAGAGRVRSALAAGPVDDARRPVPGPQDGRSWDVEFQPPPQRGPAARRTIGDELRDELEASELEMVASAKSWSSFSHRAYGELRRLPLQAEPPPRSSQRAPEIDDEQWDGPTWQELGDR